MPKIRYVEKHFRTSTLELITLANQIIDEYAAQGFDLTLRQLYYQMVARDIVPNSQREYKKLGNIINDARLTGLIDWHHIVDRTRNLRRNSHFDSPSDIMRAAVSSYQIDRWENQLYRLEVWIEKDALVGIIAEICGRLDVPYFSCRGYTSQSEMWVGAMRLQRWIRAGQKPVILHLGDHDPSGIDMTRDIMGRLTLFMKEAHVDRLALNWNQIEEYNPPPNPAKMSDSRADAYIAQFGRSSWELDALDPNVIANVIEEAVSSFRDPDLWEEAKGHEATGRQMLRAVSERFDEIAAYLEMQNGS